ncbi:hypothetical protein E2562_017689 [Oryza meyeriana var. granulata]|uniref:Uncharacterized protein n=1 Tax=Oryza meyeriana var. granulata TaxID=110450 RepID=A0A6G1BX58_9ORYZ|nr:hypothetical protein E2562_017689 [Oryza meyeriana var. granulata]
MDGLTKGLVDVKLDAAVVVEPRTSYLVVQCSPGGSGAGGDAPGDVGARCSPAVRYNATPASGHLLVGGIKGVEE